MARLKHMVAFAAMATLGAALALPMVASAAMPDGVSDKLLLYTNIHAGAINISPTGMKEMDFLREVTHARTTAPPGLGHIALDRSNLSVNSVVPIEQTIIAPVVTGHVWPEGWIRPETI